MQRPYPCFVCGTRESSIAYASDPWCGVNCHKLLARKLGMLEWDLKPLEFEAAMRRIAKQELHSLEIIVFRRSMIAEEIARGRNWREVYGTEDLLREAEVSGNWRDYNLPVTAKDWYMPRLQ